MKVSTSFTLLLVGVQSLCSSAWVVGLPLSKISLTKSNLPLRATVEGTSSTAATAYKAEPLLPEFDQAFQQLLVNVRGVISASGHSDKLSNMLPMLEHFIREYMTAGQKGYLAGNTEHCSPLMTSKRVMTTIQYGFKFGFGEGKFLFDVAHEAFRGNPELENGNTIDFYEFGCNFFRYCMDMQHSQVLGRDNLDKAMAQIAAGDNVVLLANHQTEADPQVVSVCLEQCGYKKAAAEIVYIAGHKVTTDPLAVPFSMGRNLICIHSKKHINTDPETKPLKQRQNLKAMNAVLSKFKDGGCVLWVAPSGGRDRRDVATGKVPIAPFDSKTIDMFRLMGNKSKVPTHYYTLAMSTYDLCPPPDYVEAGVGEQRNIRFVPVGIYLGEELENVGGLESRQKFCEKAMKQCEADYEQLVRSMASNK